MNENQYIKIYLPILNDTRLNSNDKIIYSIINNFINIRESNGSCWASNLIISQKSGVSIRTVQRSINKLIKLNLLYSSNIKKNSKTYRIITNNKEFLNNTMNTQKSTKIELFDYDWLNDEESE